MNKIISLETTILHKPKLHINCPLQHVHFLCGSKIHNDCTTEQSLTIEHKESGEVLSSLCVHHPLSSVSFYTGIFFSETKGQKMTKSDGNSLPGEPKKKATYISYGKLTSKFYPY